MRRTALIEAGTQILFSRGFDAVTPASVGAAAGIARSSVYQYFPSTTALLLAIIDDSFPKATAQLRAAVRRFDDPHEQIEAYLTAAFDFATDSEHRSFGAVPMEGLAAEIRDRLSALHREQYVPLLDALTRLGVESVGLSAQFIGGLLESAVRATTAGADRDTMRAALLKVVKSGPLA